MTTVRTSGASKRLTGTVRADRALKVTGSTRLTAVPPAPAWLSLEATVQWGRLAPDLVATGVLAGTDLPALGMLAEAMADMAMARSVLALEGLTIPAARGGGRKAHPALTQLATAQAMVARLLEQFGMTPAGRQRVAKAPSPPPTDGPWTRLRLLQGQGE